LNPRHVRQTYNLKILDVEQQLLYTLRYHRQILRCYPYLDSKGNTSSVIHPGDLVAANIMGRKYLRAQEGRQGKGSGESGH